MPPDILRELGRDLCLEAAAAPTWAALFDGLAMPGRAAMTRRLGRHFEVVGAPGAKPRGRLQPGDVVIRRAVGEGSLAHGFRLVTGELWPVADLAPRGLTAESARPGLYAQVVETGARPHDASHRFARRILRPDGSLETSQLVLRLVRAAAPAPVPETWAETVVVDGTAAIPPFAAAKRAQVDVSSLLAPQPNADAITWNQTKHSAVSGVAASEIRGALAGYVDFNAVTTAIHSYNQAHSSAQIALGSGDLDAVFVEAVHQFQLKCFVETSKHDGLAGEATLDSLGLIRRPGLHSRSSQSNANRQHWLNSKDSVIQSLSGNELSAATWWDVMIQPTFMGWTFDGAGSSRAVHLWLLRKLRQAESYLLSLPAYSGMTPVELARALGVSEGHRGCRPTATSKSMHTLGLALDINYEGNPWITGQGPSTANSQFVDAVEHAALLISGLQVRMDTAYLHSLSTSLSTGDIYDVLSQRNNDLKSYLGLAGDSAGIQAQLQAHQSKSPVTPGVFQASETLAAATARWATRIQNDLSNLQASTSNFSKNGSVRDPRRGFLDLHRDLVIALRDAACLAWGAVDLGSQASGDVMHFDDRRTGLGRELAESPAYLPNVPCVGSSGSSGAAAGATEAELDPA